MRKTTSLKNRNKRDIVPIKNKNTGTAEEDNLVKKHPVGENP